MIGCADECIGCPDDPELVEALLRPVIVQGELVDAPASVHQARDHRAERVKRLPAPVLSLFAGEEGWRVNYSREMLKLADRVRAGVTEAHQ